MPYTSTQEASQKLSLVKFPQTCTTFPSKTDILSNKKKNIIAKGFIVQVA